MTALHVQQTLVECGRVGWEIAQGTNASVADKVGGSGGDTKLTFYSIQH